MLVFHPGGSGSTPGSGNSSFLYGAISPVGFGHSVELCEPRKAMGGGGREDEKLPTVH